MAKFGPVIELIFSWLHPASEEAIALWHGPYRTLRVVASGAIPRHEFLAAWFADGVIEPGLVISLALPKLF